MINFCDRTSDGADNTQKDLHIAPMLDVSTIEFLNFFRILTKRTVLWTEMVVDETLIHTQNLDRHLPYSPHLSPIVIQIGGINPLDSGKATRIVESFGYDEVNLNIDCPSNRVSGKKFGAILMSTPENASAIVSSMNDSVQRIPISVKTRVGIELENGDIYDSFEHMVSFISKLRKEGCRKFVIHARKCILGGLSPAQNRLFPPLNYPMVYELCEHFPDCEFVLNGGIPGLKKARLLCYGESSNDNISDHSVPCNQCCASNGSCVANPGSNIKNLKGCMIGRAAMENPCMFWDVDRYFYGERRNPCINRRNLLNSYCEYLEKTYPRQCSVARGLTGCNICNDMYDTLQPNEDISNSIESCEIKIPSGIIDRSLKPVLGVFYNKPMSKAYRKECDRLSRDKKVRNCGPGYILRKAFSIMPNELLDEPFIFTEDLNDDDIPVYHGPRSCQFSN